MSKCVQQFTVERWGANAIAFIAEQGLTREFSDWCGGWPCPVDPKLVAAAPNLLSMVDYFRHQSCPVCNGDCASANPPVSACPIQMANEAFAKAVGAA